MSNNTGWSESAHDDRGTGKGSRLSITNDSLKKRGWTITEKAKGFKWTNPEGKTFYSSTAVEEYFAQQTEVSEESDDETYVPSDDSCLTSPENSPNKKRRKDIILSSLMTVKLFEHVE
ncbi:hypothetical protein AC249_AIPGENE26310 [Exaiptasia diaphana]|nr:hypothetical protein AC249_AIPGENE26312 [Exaiptasia diaphana]KXJ10056.1 hypothetical protein AC249_AIPGENE26310 [Exaiptasia diaphana]